MAVERLNLFDQPKHHQSPAHLLVIGASGGIGQAICQHWATHYPKARLSRLARSIEHLGPLNHPQLHDYPLELTDPESIQSAIGQACEPSAPDWVLITTGWLHDARYSPEKNLKQLDAEHLLKSYQLNAIGPALCLQQLIGHTPAKSPINIGVLSARVGSISDNQLGGWYAYRASKAALNMLIKNTALELKRQRRPACVVGLQPGTVATALSAPFQRNVPAARLQPPEAVAARLSALYPHLGPTVSGELFDYQGERFAP